MALHLSVETHLEITLDGVFYAIGRIGSWRWRLASLDPNWRHELGQMGENPPASELEALAERQIYVRAWTEARTDLTLMCCGLGSAWPGMGRELYSSFPAARESMDRVASLADWDLLALMDETDVAAISQTRWQIPYLFMLEYGQWSLLRRMGLRPSTVCGHSLGELIALCISGVLSLESAWILLETRAEHMAELETKGGRQGGMLAVPACFDIVSQILDQYPELRISNRNTERQYVLSGPRSQLLEARRQLRKQRIPAVMLGMALAFHNPAMRILRDMSLRRLSGLMAQAPQIPMLSCVDASEYPSAPQDIYTRIADLDENTVDWRQLIESVASASPGQQFLELGPQETLCSITTEVSPHSSCLAVDRKGHEGVAMRAACARLFVANCLDEARLAILAREMRPEPLPLPPLSQAPKCDLPPPPREAMDLARELVGKTCGRPAAEVGPELELRRDLGVRSSSLPFILLEAERRLGRAIAMENLFQLLTVADLARFAAGIPIASRTRMSLPRRQFSRTRPGLNRHVSADGHIRQLPINIQSKGPLRCAPLPQGQTGEVLLIAPPSDPLEKWARAGITASGASVHTIIPNNCRELRCKLQRYSWQGIVLLTGVQEVDEIVNKSSSKTLKVMDEYFRSLNPGRNPWFCLVAPLCVGDVAPSDGQWRTLARNFFEQISALAPSCRNLKVIALVGVEQGQNGQDWADMLTLELLHGPESLAVWTSVPHEPAALRICPHTWPSSLIEPVADFAGEADGSVFLGEAQFSSTGRQDFLSAGSLFNPASEGSCEERPWLLPNHILQTMAEASAIALPWLELIGFTDLRVSCLPAMPPGVIRECRVRVSSRVALPLEGVFTRCCRVRMDLDKIKANGRKSGSSRLLSDGVCLRAASAPPIKPLWSGGAGGGCEARDTEKFHNLLGLSECFLGAATPVMLPVCGKMTQGYEADLPQSLIHDPFGLANAALIAGMWTIGHYSGAQQTLEALAQWRFAAIGFIRLQGERDYRKLQWRLSWQDESLLRFDAQALGSEGQALATIHSIEFDRAVQVTESAEGGL